MATMFKSGAFAAAGGDISVMVDIVPDPKTIEIELMQVAHNLEDTLKPMLAARNVAQADMQAHFDTESTPDGDKWIALDADYARQKESFGFPSEILQRSKNMMEAATSDQAFIVTPQGLWFNWAALPASEGGENYGQIHQAGTSPAGNITPDIRAGHEGEHLRFTGGVGRGNALPARPFVGLSQDAEETIWAVYDVWFDEAIQVVIHPSGRMQSHSGGRFGKNINFS